MADIFGDIRGIVGGILTGRRRLVDMGDGTWAEKVVTAPLGASGSVASSSNPAPVASYAGGAKYKAVAASQTNAVLGATGAIGDYLDHVTILVATAATAAVTISDGSTAVIAFPNSPGGGIGVYDIPVHARATGAGWKVTTGAGASIFAAGDFT